MSDITLVFLQTISSKVLCYEKYLINQETIEPICEHYLNLYLHLSSIHNEEMD